MRDVLQRAVSCVTPGVFIHGPRGVTEELLRTSRLARSGGGHVTLTVEHRYSLVHDAAGDARSRWQARTAGYLYTLDDADGREVLAYHWHPTGRSPEKEPHLHLGAGAGSLRRELTKAHIATGFVTPVAILSLVVNDFGVRPSCTDWADRLERVNQALAMS